MSAKSNTKNFINKANEIHSSKYDYSLVNYINKRTKVTILCKTHGEFKQTPGSHLNGSGCPLCGLNSSSEKQLLTTEEFIAKANSVHNFYYNYSLVQYKKSSKKVFIICKKHGVFLQTPASHLYGSGCPLCANFKKRIVNRGRYGKYKLYYFKHIPTNTYKLGITSVGYSNRFPKSKLEEQNLLYISKEYSYEDAEELEQFLLEEFSNYRVFNKHYLKKGATEFFSKDVLNMDNKYNRRKL